MNRRDFMTVLGSSLAAWPQAARTQPADRVRRIGVLFGSAADDPESQARIAAFAHELAQLGWTDGRNVRIDIRWATTNSDNIPNRRPNWRRSHPMSFWPLPAP